MKYLLTTFTTIIAVGMFVTASPVLAQTPDGETPAEETVCDALQDDGVTKGLYGLCVAFCEAGDYADEADTITDAELAALESSTPSGRILANYNKKKARAMNPNDPDMPCILVEEPCPCWTADELALVADGIYPSGGSPALRVGCYATHQILSGGQGFIQMFDYNSQIGEQRVQEEAVVWNNSAPSFQACRYELTSPGILPVFSFLSVQAGTLTEEQHDACLAQAVAHWDSRTECTEGPLY